MPSERNIKYAKSELDLAEKLLEKNPDSIKYKERVSWWNAFLGNYEVAEKYAVTEKAQQFIKTCKTR